MKLKRIPSLIVILLLTSCSGVSPSGNRRSGSSSNKEVSGSSNPTLIPTSSTTYVPHTGSNPFPSTSGSVTPPITDITAIPVNFTAFNDFHGQLDESGDYVGLAKLSTYLKDKKANGNIIINSGDLYQGSFLCNYDKGQLASYAFKYIGVDVHTIGNHEFDWSINSILDNQLALEQNFLGANIYDYPKTGSEWHKADLGQEYIIINLYEGTEYEVKVGVIGVIGKDQITSITSLNTTNHIFLDPNPIVKSLSRKLRIEEECDFIIASYHADDPDMSIADIDTSTGKPYVDTCFLAHTHQFQDSMSNGVPFLQAGAYSEGASNVSFTFNKVTGVKTLVSEGNVYLAGEGLTPDPVVEDIIDDAKEEQYDKFHTVIGTNTTGGQINTGSMSKFYAKISYEQALIEAPTYNTVGAIFNYSRRSLKAGDFTFSDLFETHPFLNGLYIFSVSESNIRTEIDYGNYGYINPSVSIGHSDDVYHDIIVFDYIGFHIGVNSSYEKYYNYFPSAFSAGAEHEPYKLSFDCFHLALDWLEVHHNITNSDISGSGFFGGY